MKIPTPKNLNSLALAAVLIISIFGIAPGQKMDGIERERMQSMLKTIKDAIKKDYYDPNYRGINIEARFKQAQDRLKQVTASPQALGVIAQVLMDFDDSHLYFLPPATNWRVEYGFRMRMIGDKCYVTAVKPKSKAEASGLKTGDEIVAIEGFRPTRKELWKMNYYYNILSKRTKLNLSILSPGTGQPRDVEIESKTKQLPSVITYQNFFTLDDDFEETDNDKHLFQRVGGIAIWRMPSFAFEPTQVDQIMKDKVANASGLIIDLRSNGGGYVKTLERLAGYFFEKDVQIASLKGRKPIDPMAAKSRGKDTFKGKVVVLTSSDSGSASEIFARLIQLEKRGVVLGDVSAGAVMQSSVTEGESGSGAYGIFYGASITNADVIMTDGKSLERVGVVPDELILPTAEDLAKGRDPVLARAVAVLGGQLSAEQAGQFFLYDWGTK